MLYITLYFRVVTIQHVQSQLYVAMNSDGRLITTVKTLNNELNAKSQM